MGALLRSWQRRFRPGPAQRALALSATSGSTRRLLGELAGESGFQLDLLDVPWPFEDEEAFLDALGNALGPDTSLVVLDALPASVPFVLPLAEASALCRERAPGCIVLADAAQGLLSLPLRMAGPHAAPVDALVASCGSWLCGPRGAAVLHVAPEHQEWVRPLETPEGGEESFPCSFYSPGLTDFSSWLALDEALAFWDLVGLDPARIYCQYLVLDAAEMLAGAWGTCLGVPSELLGPMALIEVPALPALPCGGDTSEPAAAPVRAEALRAALLRRGVEVHVQALSGRLYVRVSAHIYNYIEEYEALRDAVLELQAGAEL